MVEVFPIGKPVRLRSEKHRRFVASCPCCICGGIDVQAHHLLCAPEPKAKALKPSDGWCVPLCVRHHTEVHALGHEPWGRHWLLGIAQRLWAASVAAGRATDPGLTVEAAAREAGNAEEWIRLGYPVRRFR